MGKKLVRKNQITAGNKSIANSGAGRWSNSAAYRYLALVRAEGTFLNIRINF